MTGGVLMPLLAKPVCPIDSDDSIPAEYFNLQGMKIANPAAGQIYIMKKGSTVKKVVK